MIAMLGRPSDWPTVWLAASHAPVLGASLAFSASLTIWLADFSEVVAK